MTYKGMILATVTLGLIACGSGSDGEGETLLDENQPKVETPQPEPDTQEPEVKEPVSEDTTDATFLEGMWRGLECFDINSNLDHSRTDFEFSGSEVTITQPVYNSSDCAEEFKIAEYVTRGSFSIGEDFVIASGETVSKIDFNITQAIATPLNADGVAFLENKYQCEGLEWTVQQSQSILDCRKQDGWNSEIKTIVNVDGDLLRLGTGEEAADGYPTQLEAPEEGQQRQ